MALSSAQLTELVETRGPALLRTAYLLCGNEDQAADLLQTALVKTFLAARRLRDPSRVEPYVRRVMLTTFISWRRRSSFFEAPVDRVPETVSEDFAAQLVNRRALDDHLRVLSPGQRAVVVLRFYEDNSVEQTADTLGCSVGTVKSQTSRALAVLQARLTADPAVGKRYL
jgi:RNA polymerase sigma-70 factor (sigma-E family)